MAEDTRPSLGAKRRAGAVSKLFRVLVAGGIALAGCATTKGKNPDKPGDQGADSQPSSQPAQPGGGVQGW